MFWMGIISEPQLFVKQLVTRSSPTVAFVEFAPSPQLKNEEPEEKEQKQPENEMRQGGAEAYC